MKKPEAGRTRKHAGAREQPKPCCGTLTMIAESRGAGRRESLHRRPAGTGTASKRTAGAL